MTVPQTPARHVRFRGLRQILLAIAGITSVWAPWLLLFGGFTVAVFGARIRSHEPWRVGLAACAAVVGYFVAGGTITPLVITTVPDESELCKSRAEGNPLRFQTVR
jgi:hypothetical protein